MAVVGLRKKRKGEEDDCWRWVLLERVKGQELGDVWCLAFDGRGSCGGRWWWPGEREGGREAMVHRGGRVREIIRWGRVHVMLVKRFVIT